jgi:uncharacterized protein
MSIVGSVGMDRNTGKALDPNGVEHLQQSLYDIMFTPIGSRVMPMRGYGSTLFDLIDTPGNKNSFILFYAGVAAAIELWEPRLQLSRVQVLSVTANGNAVVSFSGVNTITGQPLTITVAR